MEETAQNSLKAHVKSIKKTAEQLKAYRWKKGQSGNPGGRPKGSLKNYVAMKLADMTEEEKNAFLKKVAPELIWRMAEGNPDTKTEHSGEVKIMPILGGITQKEDE